MYAGVALKNILLVPILISMMMAAAGATASYVSVINPFHATIYNNGTMYLGKVGPGQTFSVNVSSTALNSSGVAINIGWNRLVASGVPPGWVVQNSSQNVQNLSVTIKPSPDTLNGTYEFYLTAINLGNYSKLGSVRFLAIINVTPDVFKLDVSPKNISVAPGDPAYIQVTINNTGVSDNPFVISSSGIPGWNSTETVFALHNTSRVFTYPIYQNTPGRYQTVVQVESSSSPLVQKESNVNLVVKRSILNDYSAFGQGTIVYPIIDIPAYAVMYLISLLKQAG
jgi:hypothetical protein